MNKYKLRDLLSIKNGKDYKHLEQGNYPVYGTGGVMTYVNNYLYDGESILLPRKGTLDNIMFVSGRFWTVDTMYWSIVNNDIAYPKYLYCYLSLLDLSCRDSGSTLPSMTFDSYYNLDIYLPGLEEQKKIANKIFAINQKIENNNKINRELESLAKTLYDYWFLQFEFPNEEGKPYKSSGGKMVWNEELKREIPEGWKVKNVFECSDTLYGYPLSTEEFNEERGLEVIRIRDLNDYSFSAKTTENIGKKYLSKKGDLLIGMDGNFHMVFWPKDGQIINQRIFRIRGNGSVSPLQIYFDIKPLIKQRESSVARSTVGHLSDKDLKATKVLVSNSNLINEVFDYILNLICINLEQNQQLSSLRDWLLPMLMNGQVTFKEENAEA